MPNAASRILIVDDEPPLLKMLAAYLRRLGFDAVTAASTEKAWEEVDAAPTPFDVAVLDATMGGVPMDELATYILEADPRVCVIAASGYPVDIAGLLEIAPGRVELNRC